MHSKQSSHSQPAGEKPGNNDWNDDDYYYDDDFSWIPLL